MAETDPIPGVVMEPESKTLSPIDSHPDRRLRQLAAATAALSRLHRNADGALRRACAALLALRPDPAERGRTTNAFLAALGAQPAHRRRGARTSDQPGRPT